jgi:hypothetical protein
MVQEYVHTWWVDKKLVRDHCCFINTGNFPEGKRRPRQPAKETSFLSKI